ncbi:hypothetical protein A167_03127 [Alcanivorax sp. S71-1-4]|nr:hypothetical protein A167_03127 [Alcanivorax sp. S71-1-4]
MIILTVRYHSANFESIFSHLALRSFIKPSGGEAKTTSRGSSFLKRNFWDLHQILCPRLKLFVWRNDQTTLAIHPFHIKIGNDRPAHFTQHYAWRSLHNWAGETQDHRRRHRHLLLIIIRERVHQTLLPAFPILLLFRRHIILVPTTRGQGNDAGCHDYSFHVASW